MPNFAFNIFIGQPVGGPACPGLAWPGLLVNKLGACVCFDSIYIWANVAQFSVKDFGNP